MIDCINYQDKILVSHAGKCAYSHVITFGCQQNEADSERIRGILASLGYKDTSSPECADVIILNTCAIREHAEMKALSMLGNFKAQKRKNPDLIIGVVGCMSAEPRIVEHVKREFHYVSFTIEPNMIHRLPEAIFNYISSRKRSFILGEDRGEIVEGLPILRGSNRRPPRRTP